MKSQPLEQVLKVEVTDPVAWGRAFDYADAYESRVAGLEPVLPEVWLRAGMDDVPAIVDRVTSWLGVRDTPDDSGRLAGGDIVESTADVVQVDYSLPLLDVTIVARNVGSTRVLTTLLTYRRPFLARLVWMLIGVWHRRAARRLVRRSATVPSSGHGIERGS